MGLDEILRTLATVTGAAMYTGFVGYVGYQVGKAASALSRRGVLTKGRNNIAVITIDGAIGAVPMGGQGRGVDYLRSSLDSLVDNKSVKAIILEVNSPGGVVNTSFEMVNLLREVRQGIYRKDMRAMPIVGRARSVAASAGYQLLCACDAIVAYDNSIVGSIGAFSVVPDASDLLKTIGVKVDVFKTAKYKASGLPLVGMTDDEKERYQEKIDETVEYFLRDVAQSRRMTVEHLKETYANGLTYFAGKVVSGPNQPGLVDVIGNRQTAIYVAERLGRFKCDNVFEVHPLTGLQMVPFKMRLGNMIRDYLFTPGNPTF